jgi:hypothetical protein
MVIDTVDEALLVVSTEAVPVASTFPLESDPITDTL